MFKNYIKIAWRNIWKSKLFSAINIISLAIGLSASFVIGLMVYYDFTFDDFHKDSDRIFRITTTFKSPEGTFGNAGVTVPLYQVLKEEIPEVETTAALYTGGFTNVMNPGSGSVFKDPEYTVFTNPEYFKIFNYTWIAGSAENALHNPNEVVLTQKRARQYFPKTKPENILGKELVYNDSIVAKVTGIVANLNKRTDLIFEEFLSRETAKKTDMATSAFSEEWGSTSNSAQIFVKLVSPNAATVQTQLDQIAKNHQSEYDKKFDISRRFNLQALKDLHFDTDYGIFSFNNYTADRSVLMGLGFIAGFLLLLGCVNFINLNTAQAYQRAKEIGIRKTLGSSKKQLISQFLGETFLLTVIAAVISLVLASYLLKVFSDFIPDGLAFSLFKEPVILLCCILLLLVVTLLSGLYPAFVLTRFKPYRVIRSTASSNSGKSNLRKFLTVFQFTIAQVFLIATLLVGKQIRFLMNADMGFKTDAVAYVSRPWQYKSVDKNELLLQKFEHIPGIEKSSLGGMPPASFSTHSSGVTFQNEDREIKVDLEILYGDLSYLDVYGIPLIAGRIPLNDTINEYVVNETALEALGFKDPKEILDKNLNINKENYRIVGVMQDFKQRSLKTGVEPMVFGGDTDRGFWSQFRNIHVTLPTHDSQLLKQTLARIEDAYQEVYPGETFEIKFIDDTIARFYEREKRLSTLLNWATGLSILISILGLLGLVIHTVTRRTKEIGVRKVLGATVAQLNMLLCKDFLKLIALAFLIAVPFAWWGIQNWLQDYVFRTEMSWWVFALSGLGMITLALVIISLKTIRTASKNPVKSLGTE